MLKPLHRTAHRCRKDSITAVILSDEIDVCPMSSSVTGVKPRNVVIGRPPSLTTRRDDPFFGEQEKLEDHAYESLVHATASDHRRCHRMK